MGKEGRGVPGPSGCLRVCPAQARACPPWAERVLPALERVVQEDKGPPLLFTGLGGSGKAFYKLASQTFYYFIRSHILALNNDINQLENSMKTPIRQTLS